MEILRVENLVKTYGEGENQVNAVDDISLSVEKGELDLDGRVDSICYSESGMKNKQDSFMSRLLR